MKGRRRDSLNLIENNHSVNFPIDVTNTRFFL